MTNLVSKIKSIQAADFTRFNEAVRAMCRNANCEQDVERIVEQMQVKANRALTEGTSGAKGSYTRSLTKFGDNLKIYAGAQRIQKALDELDFVSPTMQLVDGEYVIQGEEAEATEKESKLNPCLCGCGAMVKKRFKQGHDQRLKGYIKRAVMTFSEPVSSDVVCNKLHEMQPETKSTMYPNMIEHYMESWAIDFVGGSE